MEAPKFSTTIILSVIISALLAFGISGTGIVGIFGACVPLLCGVPIGIFLSSNLTIQRRLQEKKLSFLPAIMPLCLAIVFTAVSLYDQNPRVMFKRILADPIPTGVEKIRAYTDQGGIDIEYGLAFEAPSSVIDDLIAKLELETDTNDSSVNKYNAPFEYFPDIDQNQTWTYYSKTDNENEISLYMWVNEDRTLVLFKVFFW